MRAFLDKELTSIEGVEFYDDGDNIYAWKGVAPYPCVVAHMDTVHSLKKNLTAVVINGRITGMDATTMTQTGIGGDDKVGIYVALQMLREHDNIKAFFPRDEEIGCVGSQHVTPEFFDDVTIALQCDRRGNKDFITKASGVELSSKKFQEDVLPIITQYGYRFEHGMMTDVMQLKESGIDISMANISCGYYNPHMDNEYVDVADVHRVTTMVSEIIRTLGQTKYPHIAPTFKSSFGRYDDEAGWGDGASGLSYTRQIGSQSIHSEAYWCQDCMQRPATNESKHGGLCHECYEWYALQQNKPFERHSMAPPGLTDISKKLDFSSKPDYGPIRIIQTPDEAQAVAKYIKVQKKKKRNKKRWSAY